MRIDVGAHCLSRGWSVVGYGSVMVVSMDAREKGEGYLGDCAAGVIVVTDIVVRWRWHGHWRRCPLSGAGIGVF